jgi:hypothetical protein
MVETMVNGMLPYFEGQEMHNVEVGSFGNNAANELAEDILDVIHETAKERHLSVVEVLGTLQLVSVQIIDDAKSEAMDDDA